MQVLYFFKKTKNQERDKLIDYTNFFRVLVAEILKQPPKAAVKEILIRFKKRIRVKWLLVQLYRRLDWYPGNDYSSYCNVIYTVPLRHMVFYAYMTLFFVNKD